MGARAARARVPALPLPSPPTCSSSTSPARRIGTTLTGCPGSTKVQSATPHGVSTSPETVGSHPSTASYTRMRPNSAIADRKTGEGDALLRATASQCAARGWDGT